MRLRNVPGAQERIEASPYVVEDPAAWKGRWRECFDRMASVQNGQLHVEIGTGKGRFLLGMAAQHPDVLFLGIEKFSSVLVRAVDKAEASGPPNLLFIRMEAELLENVFDKGEVNRIYLNFSDPWPKDRHEKRRLTSDVFLRRYREILVPQGEIEFKTDNEVLFTYSVESCMQEGWTLTVNTRDLHGEEVLNAGNIMTEYEERFSQKGNRICKLVATRP